MCEVQDQTMGIAVLAREIRALPWNQRQKLLQILDRVEKKQVDEAVRRDCEMNLGTAKGVPVRKFFQGVRARFRKCA
jgi:hypothetical protein